MRNIQVSTAVFGHIWGQRRDGEDNEDAILSRLFGVKQSVSAAPDGAVGYNDKRYGVMFPEGFQVSRVFKGTKYDATATGGKWKLENTGVSYDSLSAVGDSIKTGIENVWQAWHFIDERGVRNTIATLRDPDKVIQRRKRPSF